MDKKLMMKTIITHIFLLLIILLPSKLKNLIYSKFFNWEIDKTAKIGLSFIHAKKVKIGAHSKIKHFNYIRNLELLELGEHVTIGNLNQVSAIPLKSKKHFQHEKNRVQALIIESHSSIVKKHFFDCNGTIKIGHHTIIAGFGSSFFTHSINITESIQETSCITIGNYCMVGAHSVITKGAILPEYSILGANSTLNKPFTDTHVLYSGVPAKFIKRLNPDSKFFKREVGFVK